MFDERDGLMDEYMSLFTYTRLGRVIERNRIVMIYLYIHTCYYFESQLQIFAHVH